MNAFIVRPFGEKNGVNFDQVEIELIKPALTAAGISGATTAEIFAAGNIRHDMFQLLLTADLVIADVSIHNANVFYELGVRHALRDKRTILIRYSGDEIPFDLKTDRYFTYDKANPGAALDTVKRAIEATVASEERDSPVFSLLPELQPQPPWAFLVAPRKFREDVERLTAQTLQEKVESLLLEAKGQSWEMEGLRLVGRALFHHGKMEDARKTWEQVRAAYPDDSEANLKLGTIYQKLKNLPESDLALQRVIELNTLSPEERAEKLALLGSNAKTRWIEEWQGQPAEQMPAAALRSAYLKSAYRYYEQGFLANLNHFYSGINALAMVTIMTELAGDCSGAWSECFDDESKAEDELARLQERQRQLAASVTLSVEAQAARMARERRSDRWYQIACADLKCLTLDKPLRIAKAYRDAMTGAAQFYFDSVSRQLKLYEQLGVVRENAQSALAEIALLRSVSGGEG